MIYPRLLKTDFCKLPQVLREFHEAAGEKRAIGTFEIRHQRPWLARLTGFPAEGTDIPVRLHVEATENEEVWTRWFGHSMRRSVQWAAGEFLVEKAGPVRIDFRIFASETGMRFESSAASLWGIPLPLRIHALARGAGSCWEIEVTIAQIGSYRGRMAPAQ
jgi:hypothetical protein